MFNESEKTFERILAALSLKTPLSAVSKRAWLSVPDRISIDPYSLAALLSLCLVPELPQDSVVISIVSCAELTCLLTSEVLGYMTCLGPGPLQYIINCTIHCTKTLPSPCTTECRTLCLCRGTSISRQIHPRF